MERFISQNTEEDSYLLKSERQGDIIKYATKHASFSVGMLAKKLKVSSKTIVNDTKIMNTLFHGAAEFQGEHGTFQLCVYNRDRFQTLSDQICGLGNYDPSSQRVACIIQTLWQSGKPFLIDDLAEEMNVSRSTLNMDLKHARELLRPYDAEIVGKPNSGLRLKDNEFLMRLFVVENIYETIYPEGFEKYVPEDLHRRIERIGLDAVNKKRFYRFLTVLIDRVQAGNTITELPAQYADIAKAAVFLLMPPIVKTIEEFLQTSLPVPEQIFLSLPIIGMQTPTNIEAISQIPVRQDVNLLLRQITDQIQKELNLNISWQEFPLDFLYHIDFLINRLLYNCQVKSPIISEIQQDSPLSFLMAKIAGQVIEKYYRNQFVISDDELSYIAAYFNVFFLENKMQFNENCNMVIVCGAGRAIARLVTAHLKKALNIHTSIDLLPDFEATRENLAKYDLIFTTEDTRRLSSISNRPIISINPVFGEHEITVDIERAKYFDQLRSPNVELNSLLLNILQPACFFTLDVKKSYQENIQVMLKVLTDQDLLDEDFPDRLAKREKEGTMVYENGVAFLHTTNKGSVGPVLALGVLQNPLHHEGREVKIVFLLGIQENSGTSDTLIIRIYEEIIRISRSPQVIEKLSQVKSYYECLGVIQREQDLFSF
ncbi:BglG family transcription antiterminator [Ethanoligenens sp.]|uniref:BglG family transcription antiterminator n=1 Tax=Ethanoligenens sp. TaxID=2099655 RepID=UPI0039ED8B97